MSKLFLLLFALSVCVPAVAAQNTFPEKWLGVWTGKMEVYNRGALRDTVDVRLTIARTNDPLALTWKTEYLSPKQPVTKDYVMRVRDAEKGVYVTDEGGGVELANYLFGDKLYNVFEVQGITLTAVYERRGDELIFEVTSGRKGETVKGVTNFSVDNLQRAVLKKSK